MTENDISPIRVAGLAGSLRGDSYTRRAVELALEGARLSGAETRLLDLRAYDLSLGEEEWDGRDANPQVQALRRELQAAQGLILGTPEYHGSFSGMLKHALDLMGFDEFEGKMIGLVGVAGGSLGANNALTGLRSVGRALHAWVLPQQVSIAEGWRKFDQAGNLQDEKLVARLHDLGRQVARFAYLHHAREAQDFLRLWEAAPENPGGER